VLVATVRALKLHGGMKLRDLQTPDPAAVERGLVNLDKHIENISTFCERPIVALNRFTADTEDEIEVVRRYCRDQRVPFAVTDHFARGGEGALELAELVMSRAEEVSRPFCPLYRWDSPVPEKILRVAQRMYGARDLTFGAAAERDLKEIQRLGYAGLPICIAKTEKSLSDDPHRKGRPEDFEITVSRVLINAGAGFLVVMLGDIIRMPGLPERPAAERIDVQGGEIVGLS